MSSLLWTLLLAVYYTECALAVSLNASIMVFSGKSLGGGTKQNPPAVLQLFMGLVNISMRTLMFSQFTALLLPNFFFQGLYYVMLVLLPFLMYLSNWLISLLCTYYCVSITNFTNQAFIWVRRTFSSWLPCLLILSGIVSIALSIPNIWTVTEVDHIDNTTLLNSSYMALSPLSLTYTIPCIFLGFCLPFLISSFSLLTTAGSLLKHIWYIKRRDSGFSHPQVRAHINAVRSMVLLLLLSLVFFISEMVVYNLLSYTNPTAIVCWIIVTVFPTLEAAIIVQSSSRLTEWILGRSLCRKVLDLDHSLL